MRQQKVILSELLRRAEAHPGIVMGDTLPSGIGIFIQVAAGQVEFQVHPFDVMFDETDWRAILDDWPYPGSARPRLYHSDIGHSYLSATWPAQLRMEGMS